MPEMLRDWAMTLAGIIVFASVCEMLLPDGSYKKYLNLAIGLVLVVAVLKPFVGKTADFTEELPSERDFAQTAELAQREDVIEAYRKNLCAEIKKTVTPYARAEFEVRCDVCGSGDEFGKIEAVQILVDASPALKIDDGAIDALVSLYGIKRESIAIIYAKG